MQQGGNHPEDGGVGVGVGGTWRRPAVLVLSRMWEMMSGRVASTCPPAVVEDGAVEGGGLADLAPGGLVEETVLETMAKMGSM